MKRHITTRKEEPGLWLVYLDRGNRRYLLGVIYDRGAKVQHMRCTGYDLYDNWICGHPGSKIGEAYCFSSAIGFLHARTKQWLKTHAMPPGVPAVVSACEARGPFEDPGRSLAAAKPVFIPSELIKQSLPAKPVCRYRIAGMACHHSDEPRLFARLPMFFPTINPAAMRNLLEINTILSSWDEAYLAYQGSSSSHEDDQRIWKFPNGLGISVLVRRHEDVVYAAMLKFYPEDKPDVALHKPSGLKFKIVRIPNLNRDEYTDYWPNLTGAGGLLEFFIRIKTAAGHDWETDPFWEEQNKRALGGPIVKALFDPVIKGGAYWLNHYHCWLASCFNVRYPEDLRGFIPVAAWSELTDDRCQQWLVLTKDGKFYVDDGIRPASCSFAGIVYGVAPVPVEGRLYPSHIFDWIFKTVIPKVQEHEQEQQRLLQQDQDPDLRERSQAASLQADKI